METLIKKCPECGGINLFFNKEKGEVICKDCGLVIEEKMIDFGQEWRDFDEEGGESRRRAGAPSTFTKHDQGLGTDVGKVGDLYSISDKKERNKFFRLRKWQYRISTAIERNLKLALSELKRVSSYLKLPESVEEEAARIYTQAVQRGLVRGRSIESVVAASIYLACRIHRIPRRLDEIVTEAKTNRKQISQAVRLILFQVKVDVPLPSANDLIPRLSADLALKGRTVKRATEIIRTARKERVTIGKDPGGIAGAALYIASILEEDRRTQREIAEVSRVTEVTIRNRYKELVRSLGISFEPK